MCLALRVRRLASMAKFHYVELLDNFRNLFTYLASLVNKKFLIKLTGARDGPSTVYEIVQISLD